MAANPLARPLAGALGADLQARLASATLPALDQAWRDEAGGYPRAEAAWRKLGNAQGLGRVAAQRASIRSMDAGQGPALE